MRKKILLFGLLTFSTLMCQAQTTSSHVDALRVKIGEAKTHIANNDLPKILETLEAISLSLEQFKAYESASLEGLRSTLTAEINALKSSGTKKDQEIDDLKKKLEVARTDKTKEVLQIVEGIIKDRDNNQQILQQALKDKQELQTKYDNLLNAKEDLATQNALQKSESERLKANNELYFSKLDTYSSMVKIGLSIGFNYFWNNQLDYIVQPNSLVKESGSRDGMSGIISGVVTIRLSDKQKFPQHNAVINIPLGDFTSGSDRAVGIFNNRIAVGLGYSITPFESAPNLSFTSIINVSPYQKIDYDLIKDVNFNLPTFTKLKPEDYGATTAVSPSLTLGVVYSFINAGGRGN